MKRHPTILMIILSIISIIVTLALTEGLFMLINRFQGVDTPFLLMKNPNYTSVVTNSKKNEKFSALDPHLGYAHGNNDRRTHSIAIPYSELPGFVVYSTSTRLDWKHPVIVILGGSTADPYFSDTSWPQELATLLKENNIDGTVINGGVGGYSSSQELIKLLRDVLELSPDIVITYDGLLDMGMNYRNSTPMVHDYQKNMFTLLATPRGLLNIGHYILFPSTSSFVGRIKKLLGYSSGSLTVNFGIESQRAPGESWIRNIDSAHMLTKGWGIKYLAVMQPASGLHGNIAAGVKLSDEYLSKLRETYDYGFRAMKSRPFMADFTRLLLNENDVFTPEGRHLLPKGDRLVAEAILQELLQRRMIIPQRYKTPAQRTSDKR